MQCFKYKFIFTFLGISFFLIMSNHFTPYLYTVYSSDQYLGMHTLLEFIAIFLGFAAFSIIWLLKAGLDGPAGRFLIVLGASFFTVGSIDLFHTLSYHGMPPFITPSSYQKATFLWIFSRFCVVAGFVAAFSMLRNKQIHITDARFTVFLIAINFAVIMTALLLATRYLYLIPPLFIEGAGLTPLKLYLEYILLLFYAVIFGLLCKYRAYFKDTTFANLGYFWLFAMASEITFTFYKSVYDTYNLIGHIYKICAYWFLFKAVYLSGIVNHFYILSEMGKMSAQLLSDRGTISTLLEIQMEKLKQLIPRAERIVFYVKEDGDIYRSGYIWGKFSELLSSGDTIHFQNILQLLGPQINLYHQPHRLLAKLDPNDYTQSIAPLWQAATQLLYIPLLAEEKFYGFVMLYSFKRFSRFSDDDLEKAQVFQKFATLTIAQLKYQETISRLSYEDGLTQLPNRRYFFEQMAEVQYEAIRYGIPFTLVFLDMNNLKYINDIFGHAAGDEALRTIALKLKETVRASDITARLGGDEFAIILKNTDLADGQHKIAELRPYFAHLDLPQYKVSFSLAVGGATYPTEATTQEVLLKLADDRMYEHKKHMKEAKKE